MGYFAVFGRGGACGGANVIKSLMHFVVKWRIAKFAVINKSNAKQTHLNRMSKFRNISKMMILVCAIIIGAASATAQELANRKHGTVREQMEQSSLFQGNNTHFDEVRAILDYANSFIGTRYRRGSSSPKGFDCSGFTSYVFKNFGYQLTRSSSSQVSDGTPVAKNELQPGDLVFFNGRAVGKRVGHVGIVTEVKEDGKFKFIHSSNGKGVIVSSSEEAYYKRRYVGASRVVEQKQCEIPIEKD